MKSCYDRAEPGVLFADNMMKNNPIAYMGRPNSTNPSLRKGTKVLTNSGIESIENLEGKKFKVQNLYGDWVSAECFFSGKDKPLYDIEFASGNNILATPEHKWPVMTTTGGWAKLETSNLNKGDIIPFLNSNCEGLNINNDLSRDEGLMLGWLYGDGWIHIKEDGDRHEYGFFFNKNEYYIAEKILSIVNSFKDTKSNINTDKDGNFVFQVSSNIFHTYMKNMGVQGKDNGFPIIIWKSNINFILGFLDGLISSDGYIGTKLCPTLTLVTSHDKMAKDYADLMGFLGVRSKSRKTITKKPSFPNKKCYNKKNYIRFDISTNGSHLGDLKKVGFSLFHKEKNEKFNVACDTIITRRRQDYGRNYIRGVKLTNLKEDVWDITVHDDTHCFRVGCGITGNCGEIPGLSSITTVCLLGSLNLTQYVKIRSSGEVYFDFEEYKEDIKVFMRMLDNVNDLTYTPLPAYQWAVENLRQVGMGINGLGSTLMMLSIPYNSKDAIEFTKKICQLKEDLTWQTSALLAKEKGTFGAYIKEEFESTEYFKSDRITEETKELIRKYGVRNSKTTTCPPLGNCVVGTTEIVTSEGNIRIKDIFMENGITDKDISNKWYLPLKDIYVKTLRGYKRVVGYYLNKKDEVLTIATNNNNKIKGTRNHKVLVKVSDTSAKWVKLDDLKVGQKILLARPPIIF
jgi:ribonucleotide reductase alpha subunit